MPHYGNLYLGRKLAMVKFRFKNMNDWQSLGIKDKIQYSMAIILVISGIAIAFLSFFLNAFNIATGVLIYIAQAFITAGGIFGVSIYFKSKIGEFETKADNKIIDVLTDALHKISNGNSNKENGKNE